MKNQIIIELSHNDSQIMGELCNMDVPFEKCEGKQFDAETLIITLIISVLPTAITQICNIITTAIQRNKDMKVKYHGVEIQGFDKEDIFEILKRISSVDSDEAK